jgi:GNAT superfamily N-acetyltransferase
MPSEIDVRPADTSDLETIVEFNVRLARETEDRQLNRSTLTDGVRQMLLKPERGRYFVAVHEGVIVGQVMHTHEWSDWRNGDIWWLQSVYVHREFRRRGIFRQMLDYVTQIARDSEDVVAIRLYMERDNTGAQATYTDLGFQDPGYKVFEIEF